MPRTLLGIGIGSITIALAGFVGLALFGTETTNWVGHPMMEDYWVGGNGATLVEPPFSDADEIIVTLDDFSIDPSEISVEAGRVNVTLTNRGAAVHDLTVPDLGIRILVSPGETVTAGLEFDSPGTYDTLCSIPGHASLGMTGSLVVRPAA